MWDNTNDLDLKCLTPSGEIIGVPSGKGEHKKGQRSDGELDVDANANPKTTTATPVAPAPK